MFNCSSLYLANKNSKAHVVVNQGGTSSGKTYAIDQVLFTLACEHPKIIITVVGQDIPNLKVGALRDALNIYENSEPLKALVQSFNKADRIFYMKNGSKIEFNSYDNAQDAKSGKRDYLFINEANGIPFEFYTELSLRTSKKIFIDYNPNSEFWVHDHLLGKPSVQLLISDHRHNPFLSDVTRAKIEALKDIDKELWRVYARGLTGKIEGLVITNWFVCEDIPEGAKLVAYGLDFGFTNDETGCLAVYIQDGELWVNELLYQTGLTNPDIAKELLPIVGGNELICDSAEPKSIEELSQLGLNADGANKGPDSIKNGIDILRRYKINVTRKSVNLRSELGKYKWKVDRITGRALNVPIDKFNHLIDPLRYVALNKLNIHMPRDTDFGW
jgi:phage terminase large subunit